MKKEFKYTVWSDKPEEVLENVRSCLINGNSHEALYTIEKYYALKFANDKAHEAVEAYKEFLKSE